MDKFLPTPWNVAFHARNPLYHTWKTMLRRCIDPTFKDWHLYGGRKDNPVTVCERWKQSREAFVADMGPRPSPNHTLDRIDGSKGYTPDNCRWATPKEQARNTARNHIVTFEGRTASVAEWAEILNLRYMTLFQRINRGWPIEKAIRAIVHDSTRKSARNRKSNNLVTHNGETLCVAEWAERFGMNTRQLAQRLRQGWTIERALTTPMRHYR